MRVCDREGFNPKPIFWCSECDKGYCDCVKPEQCEDTHTMITILNGEELCEACVNNRDYVA